MCVYRIPLEVRADDHGGPTTEAVELSESDKKIIVELYSVIRQGTCIRI